MEQLGELRDEEVVVLEHCQDAEVEDNVQPHPCFGCFLRLGLTYEKAATPRAERGERYQQQETPVPPAVEHIARHHNKGILQFQLPLRLADEAVEDKPIEQKNYRKEYRELNGVE